MGGIALFPRFLASTVLAAVVGVQVSAVVPSLLFGGSLQDYASLAAPLAMPALVLAFGTGPLLGLELRADGPHRFVWLCVLAAVLLMVLRDIGWASASGLTPSATLLWATAFKAILRGVPAGLAAAAAALFVLRLLPRNAERAS